MVIIIIITIIIIIIIITISYITVGVVNESEPHLLTKHGGGHIELMDDWAQHLLKLIKWIKSKSTTREPSEKFLQEYFSYPHKISQGVLDQDIPLEIVLNLDQTPLSNTSPVKYVFWRVKCQIAATFTVSATGFSYQFIWHTKVKPKDLYHNTALKRNFTLLT